MNAYRSVKIVTLGQSSVGKTSLVNRYTNDVFKERYDVTVGGAIEGQIVHINGCKVVLCLWDTAGAEKFRSLNKFFYRKADAAVVCYDLTDENTFHEVDFWVTELQNHVEECKIYLVGCKRDLVEGTNCFRRRICSHHVEKYADAITACAIFETSSKTGEHVGDLFHQIAADFVASNKLKTESINDAIKLSYVADEEPEKRTCCGGKAT